MFCIRNRFALEISKFQTRTLRDDVNGCWPVTVASRATVTARRLCQRMCVKITKSTEGIVIRLLVNAMAGRIAFVLVFNEKIISDNLFQTSALCRAEVIEPRRMLLGTYFLLLTGKTNEL